MVKQRSDLVERFWSLVDRGPPDQCWLWKPKTYSGYGRFTIDGRSFVRAHRFSLEQELGRKIKPGHFACHKCGNKRCVNPRHLYEGTARQNARDAKRDGAWLAQKGERVSSAVLTERKVLTIRRLVSLGRKQADLARYFGVHRATISQVVRRATWRHLP